MSNEIKIEANHEEAYLLAQMKCETSNLAVCYLQMKHMKEDSDKHCEYLLTKVNRMTNDIEEMRDYIDELRKRFDMEHEKIMNTNAHLMGCLISYRSIKP